MPPLTAVILAGGSGTRMGGVDKALLPWQGRSFIDHIVERVAPQAAEILINSNRPNPYPALGLPIIGDPWPEQRGPLAGVLAGLEAAAHDWVLFLPCDCPQPAADLAQRLWAAVDDDTMIAHAGTGNDHHYLFCLLHRSLRDDLRAYLQQDEPQQDGLQQGRRAVHRWMATHNNRCVAFDDEADAFLNINSSAELDTLLHRR